jgi:hypothetical protein
MNKSEQEKFQQLQNQINHERQCADLLADALIHGGMTRQFEALLMHETLRNGIQYPGVTLKSAVRRKRSPNHPMQWRFIEPKPNPEED